MPAIDRALLRIGCYELLYEPDMPTAVVINEAVELAKRFSTDDSGRFVNGCSRSSPTRAARPTDLGWIRLGAIGVRRATLATPGETGAGIVAS